LALERSLPNRILSAPIAAFLGDISYSIYLGHPIAQDKVYQLVFCLRSRALR
jgi:peptidoglycan/LPS O-acetylase OafA/YrhL